MWKKRASFKRVLTLIFMVTASVGGAWDYSDPTYGTSDPPNYKKKKSSSKRASHAKPYVYSSSFDDPYYGTSNPPGYNERKAKEMGKIYIPPKAEPLPPIYGTGVNPRRRR